MVSTIQLLQHQFLFQRGCTIKKEAGRKNVCSVFVINTSTKRYLYLCLRLVIWYIFVESFAKLAFLYETNPLGME